MYDVSRMKDVVNFIRTHRSAGDQLVWARVESPPPDSTRKVPVAGEYMLEIDASVDELIDCGTTACVAGWTCILNGDTLARALREHQGRVNYVRVKGEDRHIRIEERAAELLGLSRIESQVVFENTDNIEEVASILSDITGEKI